MAGAKIIGKTHRSCRFEHGMIGRGAAAVILRFRLKDDLDSRSTSLRSLSAGRFFLQAFGAASA
jgi:hypothetical protein